MTRTRPAGLAALLVLGSTLSGCGADPTSASSDQQLLVSAAPGQPQAIGAPETIPHRVNPHVDGAVVSGSTGVVTPPIAYGGGPLIATPAVYLIWYGNWNQTNGSDTPAGQQIVRDWAGSIGGSPYFNINTSYSAGGTTITGNVWGRR